MSAVISSCGKYGYRLERRLGGDNTCLFIMLNPSTADANLDDPTVRRCIGFTRSRGYGRLLVGNLFAFRATNPAELKAAADHFGPKNLIHLEEMCREAKLHIIAWGRHGRLHEQDQVVLAKLRSWNICPYFLKLTKERDPCHPLYLSGNLRPEKWFDSRRTPSSAFTSLRAEYD